MGSAEDNGTVGEEQCNTGEIVSSCEDTSEMKYEESIENIGINSPVLPEALIKVNYSLDKVSCCSRWQVVA